MPAQSKWERQLGVLCIFTLLWSSFLLLLSSHRATAAPTMQAPILERHDIVVLIDHSGSIAGNENKAGYDQANKRYRFASFLVRYLQTFSTGAATSVAVARFAAITNPNNDYTERGFENTRTGVTPLVPMLPVNAWSGNDFSKLVPPGECPSPQTGDPCYGTRLVNALAWAEQQLAECLATRASLCEIVVFTDGYLDITNSDDPDAIQVKFESLDSQLSVYFVLFGENNQSTITDGNPGAIINLFPESGNFDHTFNATNLDATSVYSETFSALGFEVASPDNFIPFEESETVPLKDYVGNILERPDLQSLSFNILIDAPQGRDTYDEQPGSRYPTERNWIAPDFPITLTLGFTAPNPSGSQREALAYIENVEVQTQTLEVDIVEQSLPQAGQPFTVKLTLKGPAGVITDTDTVANLVVRTNGQGEGALFCEPSEVIFTFDPYQRAWIGTLCYATAGLVTQNFLITSEVWRIEQGEKRTFTVAEAGPTVTPIVLIESTHTPIIVPTATNTPTLIPSATPDPNAPPTPTPGGGGTLTPLPLRWDIILGVFLAGAVLILIIFIAPTVLAYLRQRNSTIITPDKPSNMDILIGILGAAEAENANTILDNSDDYIKTLIAEVKVYYGS